MAILLKNGLVYQEGEFINEDVNQPSSLAWTLVSWLQARKPTWPVFDLDHAEKLAEEDYLSKGVNTPFTGQEVYGMTALTFVSGKLVYKSKHFAD